MAKGKGKFGNGKATQEQLVEWGRMGGAAKHTKRGLELVSVERRQEIARKGAASLTKEQHAEACRKMRAAITSAERVEYSRLGGQANIQSGHLRKIAPLGARAVASKRPTMPEMVYYGLILGDPTTVQGFVAQVPDHYGVPDGMWPEHKLVVELDGGGHNAFVDRSKRDKEKDLKRTQDGFVVIRATEAGLLYLKSLAILDSKNSSEMLK